MALSHDPLWPRAGSWPAPSGPADLTILGVPAHLTSLSPTNAHETPAAVRDALQRYSPALVEQGEPIDLGALRFADAGDIVDPDSPEGEDRTRARVAELAAQSRLVVALGGDNSVTYATAQGSGTEALITFDAHYDLRDGVSNGSPVRRLLADGLDGRHVVQIGIADFANSVAYAERAREHGITVIGMDEVRRRGIDDVVAQALEVVGDRRTHLDIDVDVTDRAAAPGCPASLPGGLHPWELRALARGIARHHSVVSADIVEIDATVDAPDQRTVRLAALCVLDLAAGLALRA
ncbi:agmatinase family protein [Microbacterium gorillae]|uniref:agmatinase family protein n=1 Tax=Microbacterium gorillae TaxID=1231063 RepID=UPI00058B56A5|nr:agmatinase family protein [Microbacterium gorillae]